MITYLESERPVHPSYVRVPLFIDCAGVHRVRVLLGVCLEYGCFSESLGRVDMATDRISEVPDGLDNILVQFEHRC